MGYQIIIGPLSTAGSVQDDEKGRNCVGMGYWEASSFAELHPGVWAMLRNGDAEGTDAVVVPLTPEMQFAITTMPDSGDEMVDAYRESLQTALDFALNFFGPVGLYVETR